jgi:hypothetical protein
MKSRLMRTMCFIALLCCSFPAFAQNRLDITLEGPWILFQVPKFNRGDGTGKTVSVLIAMAPGVVGMGTTDFHYPALIAGDGYYVEIPRIYCVNFQGKCGENVAAGPDHLSPDGYPQPTPLSVKNHWKDWVEAYKNGTYVTVLILPMPDSYSNDGVYPMRFGKQFDSTGNTYVETLKYPSIGVQLHYGKGPTDFSLSACDSANPTVSSCNLPAGLKHPNTKLDNSGTLRIVMKAPETADYCDNHVRTAYPKMLNLLDNRPLKVGQNDNQDKAYIDPAGNVDDLGKPDYQYNAKDCLPNDPQKLVPFIANGSGEHKMSDSTQSELLKSYLTDIANVIDGLHALTDDQRKSLLLSTVHSEVSRATDPNFLSNEFPRLSQLSRIDQLLHEASSQSDALAAQLTQLLNRQLLSDLDLTAQDVNGDPAPGNERSSDTEKVLDQLKDVDRLRTAYKRALAANPSKDAKDCRAPLMLVGQ